MELLNFIQMFFFVCCVAIGTIEYDRWWKHMSYSYIVTVNIILQANKLISIVIERGRGVLGSGNKLHKIQAIPPPTVCCGLCVAQEIAVVDGEGYRWCCARIYEHYLNFSMYANFAAPPSARTPQNSMFANSRPTALNALVPLFAVCCSTT
jgi:hypothetical protein